MSPANSPARFSRITCARYTTSGPHLHRNFRNRLWQTVDNAETCPIVFNVLERLKTRLGFRGKHVKPPKP